MTGRRRFTVPRGAALAVGVLACVLDAYLVTQHQIRDEMIGGDGHYTWLWARSLAFDGDLDLTNDVALCGDPWNLGTSNYWGVGYGVLMAPFLLGARLLFRLPADALPYVAGACRGPLARHAMVGGAVYATLALALGYRLAARHVKPTFAVAGAALAGLASPLFWYAGVVPSYNHAASAFVCALFLERWDAGRADAGRADARRADAGRSLRSHVLLGAVAGLAATVRLQSVLVTLPLVVEGLLRAGALARARDGRGLARHAGRIGASLLACAAAFSPQLLAWHATTGRWLGEPHAAGYVRPAHPELAGPLFFPSSGLLANSPLLLLALVGLVVGALRVRVSTRARARVAAAAALGCFVATWYVVACTFDWWGAAGYPGRRFCEATAPFVLGYAFALEGAADLLRRRASALVAASAVVVAALGGVFARSWPHDLPAVGPAPSILGPWLAAFTTRVHDAVGNPTSLPASLAFAVRHQTHPKHYDMMAPFLVTYAPPGSDGRYTKDTIWAGGTNNEHFFLEGFGPVKGDGELATRDVCAGRVGRVVVPLFDDRVRRVDVRLGEGAALGTAVTLAWGGVVRAERVVAEGGAAVREVRFDVPAGTSQAGTNELTLRPAAGCVAVRTLRFRDVP